MGFRFFAQGEAQALGLRGWVRNLPDGRVEAYAMGDERSLSKFGKLLARGPLSAQVDRIEEFDEPLDDRYASFEIGV